MINNSYVIEDLYYNIYYKDRIPFRLNYEHDNLKCGIYKSDFSTEELKKAFNNKIWITNSPIGWIPDLPKLLEQHYNIK